MSEKIAAESDVSIRAARFVSRAVFGGATYRIEIGAAIADRDIVNTAELAEDLGIVRQSVNKELQILESVGLLTRPPRGEGRKVFLMKEPSAYWEWCKEAMTNAREMLDRRESY